MAKRITTVIYIEENNKENNKNFKGNFPEYPDCLPFVEKSLDDLLNTAPVYLSVYILSKNEGEFFPHTCSIKDLLKNGQTEKTNASYINCDSELVSEILQEMNISPESYLDYILSNSNEIENGIEKIETIEEKYDREKKIENDVTNNMIDTEEEFMEEFSLDSSKKKKEIIRVKEKEEKVKTEEQTEEDPGEYVVTKGKYTGKKIKELPESQLEWVIEKFIANDTNSKIYKDKVIKFVEQRNKKKQ